jgi:outer membrane protein OmpA-like peptidoglycan-associated protein
MNRFKAAGFDVEVASWLGGPDPVPLSGQEVEQTLGSDVVSGIANKLGVSQCFARTILGYAIPKVIVLLAPGGAVPLAIHASASSFPDSAIPLSSPIEEITKHRAEQRRPSRTKRDGAAHVIGGLIIPSTALLITLALLFGYFIGAGDHAAMQSTPIETQNVLVASSPAPSIPTRLALSNENGLIVYSGTVRDNATRFAITDSLKTVFGANKVTGDLVVDQHATPASWTKDLKAALDKLKLPGSQALFEGDAVTIGGTIPNADRDRIISSLKSVLWPQLVFAQIVGGGATEMAMASSALKSVAGKRNPIDVPYQSTINLPTIYFATNSADVPSSSKALLQQAAALMKQLPAGKVIRVSGFTDSAGNRTANMKLSQRRANAVRRALVHAGVDPAMLSAKGYGSSHSMANRSGTVEGRSSGMMEDRRRNDRRVEFSIAPQ